MLSEIKSIMIDNFKSFGEQKVVNFRNLNILSGLNSSGKSSIYQALLLLTQSSSNVLRDTRYSALPILELNGEIIEFGLTSEILWDPEKSLSFLIEYNNGIIVSLSFSIIHKTSYNKRQHLALDSFCYKDSDSDQVVMSGMRFQHEDDIMYWKLDVFRQFSFIEFELYYHIRDEFRKKIANDEIDPFKERITLSKCKLNFNDYFCSTFSIDKSDIIELIKDEYLNTLSRDEINELLNGVGTEKIKLQNNRTMLRDYTRFPSADLLYLKPFRGYPKRIFTQIDHGYKYLGQSLKDYVFYDYDLETNEKIGGTLEEALSFWLSGQFKLCDGIKVEDQLYELATEVFLDFGGKKIPINNVGFGSMQVLPVLIDLITSENNVLALVDEPEIHLHPAAQSRLADFFLKMSMLGKKIIIETHSEYLIDRLIFLKLKYQIPDDFIEMYWISRDSNMCSQVNSILFDELGYILNKPDGFLSEKKQLVDELNEYRINRL